MMALEENPVDYKYNFPFYCRNSAVSVSTSRLHHSISIQYEAGTLIYTIDTLILGILAFSLTLVKLCMSDSIRFFRNRITD